MLVDLQLEAEVQPVDGYVTVALVPEVVSVKPEIERVPVALLRVGTVILDSLVVL